MSIIFGPINSRRFGKSLGVDLSPDSKQCNFDCLYCELKSVKVLDNYSKVLSVNEIVKAIKEALEQHKDIDYLTITANGEPTLYPKLKELIEEINSFKDNIKTLILSNASTIGNSDTQDALMLFDNVKLSLDCATKKCFKKIDRASTSVDLESIKSGIIDFSKRYRGELLLEALFVEGINDKAEEVEALNSIFLKVNNLKRIDIGTIDRPPAFNVKAISYDKLHELSLGFNKNLPINIASRQSLSGEKYNYSSDEILQTLSMRPLTQDDINTLFSDKSKESFKTLLSRNKIVSVKISGIEFFKTKDF